MNAYYQQLVSAGVDEATAEQAAEDLEQGIQTEATEAAYAQIFLSDEDQEDEELL